jgi:hypothetical protein
MQLGRLCFQLVLLEPRVVKSIPRRSALGRLALGLLGIVWVFISCARSRRDSDKTGLRDDRTKQVARDLERDLARLAQRDYSEQGIPVFLVGENRAGKALENGHRKDKEGTELAETFRRHATVFRQRRDARETDVAKLVELLAEREFGMTALRPPR